MAPIAQTDGHPIHEGGYYSPPSTLRSLRSSWEFIPPCPLCGAYSLRPISLDVSGNAVRRTEEI